jgi:hypothetical protein
MLAVWLATAVMGRAARGDDRMLDTAAWTQAEAALHAQLDKAGVKTGAITHASGRSFPVFQFSLADGTASSAIVVGGVVYLRGKPSNKTVAAILKGAKLHADQTLTKDDLLYLLTVYGEWKPSQRQLKEAVATQIDGVAPPPGYPPMLERGKSSAKLVVYRALPGGGSSPWRMLEKATLTISSSYGLSWKTEDVKVKAFDPGD